MIVCIPVPIVTVHVMLDFNYLFNCLPSPYYLMEGRENSCHFCCILIDCHIEGAQLILLNEFESATSESQVHSCI